MTDTMKTIKEIMKARGYTQRDVALIIGVSETSMSRWMNGSRTPNIRIIERIAKAIGFDIVLKHSMDDIRNIGQFRDCKTCIHSDKGKCAGTEECHECMWESKYEQQPRWIPVSERLPEPNTAVLTYIDTGATKTYCLAYWNNMCEAWEEWIGIDLIEKERGYKVIAWMPLPQPYKEGEE